jgi:hypothetical protein
MNKILENRRTGIQKAIEHICTSQREEFRDALNIWKEQKLSNGAKKNQQMSPREAQALSEQLSSQYESMETRMNSLITEIQTFVSDYAKDPTKGWAEPNQPDCETAKDLATQRQALIKELSH